MWLGLQPKFCLILCVLCVSSFQNMAILCLLGDVFLKLYSFYVWCSSLWGQTAFFAVCREYVPTIFTFSTFAHAKVWWMSCLWHHLTGCTHTCVKSQNKEYSVATLWWKPYSWCHFCYFLPRNHYLQHYFHCFNPCTHHNLVELPSTEIKECKLIVRGASTKDVCSMGKGV